MPICQIATVGRNPEWIQLGLFRFPTDMLILVTTEEYLPEAEKVKELVKGIEVRIEIIKAPRDTREVIIFLKTLINTLNQEDYAIFINVTSGLVSWQLMFYSTATILREKIKKFYIIDKEKREPIEMVLYKPLTKTETRTLLAVPERGGTLKEIISNFRTITYDEIGEEKGSKGLLSRYLKLLTVNGLVETVGEDKTKMFRLTKQGEIVRDTIS